MANPDDRETLITAILGIQDDISRSFAHDRSIPLLATTLTMQQLKILLILSFEDNRSGHELSRKLGVGMGTVTGIVDRLVARDLVTRREDPEDRRVRRVSLTTTGRQLIEELTDSGVGKFRRLMEELDTVTLQAFYDALDKLRQAATRVFQNQD